MIGIGDVAPDFSDEDISTGEAFTLSDYEDTVVVLTFSGLTWCGPCIYKAPVLQDVWEEFDPLGVQFVMVSWYDPLDQLQSALDQHGITFPVVDDPTIPPAYGIEGVPVTYILRPERLVYDVHEGFGGDPEVKKGQLRQAVLSAMGFPTKDQIMGCLYEIARKLGIVFIFSWLRKPKVMGETQTYKSITHKAD